MARKKQHCMTRKPHGEARPPGTRADLASLMDMPPWDWPRDAGKTFHQILTDAKASGPDRIVAARLAGDFTVINDALSDALLGITSGADQTEELRAAAAISLGPVLEHADTFEFEDPGELPVTEHTFHRIRHTLHNLYLDESVPKLVRRRILEASVRSPEDWHRDAIGRAYSSGDRDWMLTAVFSMKYVRGFENQILDALNSRDTAIHYEAVSAAGNWELDAAWPHIFALVDYIATPKSILIAAIGAAAAIRPHEAREILVDLTDSDDEEISEAAIEAVTWTMPEKFDEEEDEEDTGDWLN